LTGVSYRRLDYWTRKGLFPDVSDLHPGSGMAREYSARDLEIAGILGRLCAAGMSDLLDTIASTIERERAAWWSAMRPVTV